MNFYLTETTDTSAIITAESITNNTLEVSTATEEESNLLELEIDGSWLGAIITGQGIPEGTFIQNIESGLIQISQPANKTIKKVKLTLNQASRLIIGNVKVVTSSLGDHTSFRVVIESNGKIATTQLVI